MFYSDSDNPFRPEGDLAHEADEYVRDFVTKKQQQLDQSLKSTSSLNNNQSKSVSLILSQTGVDAEVTANGLNTSSISHNGNNTTNNNTNNHNNNTTTAVAEANIDTPGSKKDKKKKQQQKNGSAKKDSHANGQNGTAAATNGDLDESKKKVKSKCGCVIS